MADTNGLVRLDDLRPVRRVLTDVDTKANVLGMKLPHMGTGESFSDTRIYTGPETDWLLGPAESDPMYKRRDLIPKDQQERLDRIRKAIDFPKLYIAHEVEKVENVPGIRYPEYLAVSSKVAADVIDLPSRTSVARQKLKNAIEKVPPVPWKIVLPAAVTGVATASWVTYAIYAASAAAALDPAVIGFMPIPEMPGMGAWYLLAHWDM